jgi:hypothetical protein
VGADGAWWFPQSSKLVRPDFVWLGGFDSHTLPPGRHSPASLVLSPLALRSPRRLALAAALVAVAATLLPNALDAQQRDSARVGAAPPADTTRRRAIVEDTVPGPPISPKRAFFSSVLVPGLGQSELDRPIAGSIFVAVETIGLIMIQKSMKELNFAKRNAGYVVTEYQRVCYDDVPIPIGGETIRTTLCYPQVDANGDPIVVEGANRYAGGRLTARRQHVEDWIALLVANHLLAGADAYVAAHLWDLPARISVRPTDRGDVAVAASIAW